MEAEDPLAQLADIHLPGEVAFWPPAPGWWVLAAVLVLCAALVCRYYYRRSLTKRRLNSALAELDQAYKTWQAASQNTSTCNQAGLDFLYATNAILKRVALVYYPQTDVAKLTGTAWLRFLDEADQGTQFSAGPGKVLSDGTYRPHFSADVDALHALTRHWIMKRYMQPKTAAARVSAPQATEVSA